MAGRQSGNNYGHADLRAVDAPGFPLDSGDRAVAVMTRAGAPNIGFLADLYHLAKMGEDVADTLSRHRGLIRHVQLADPPGRGAPGTGILAVEPLLGQLAGQGGNLGVERGPAGRRPADSSASFGWL